MLDIGFLFLLHPADCPAVSVLLILKTGETERALGSEVLLYRTCLIWYLLVRILCKLCRSL